MKQALHHKAIIISALLAYAANAVWFLVIFRERYIAELGRTKEQMNQGPDGITASVMQVAGNIVTAYVLAWLFAKLAYTSAVQGIKLAMLAWTGFVAAVLAPMYAFQAYSFVFFAITAGSVLLSMLIEGGMIGAWTRKA